MAEPTLLISCEHAVNTIPPDFKELFFGCEPVLNTHRGFDPGALDLAESLANRYRVPCFAARISRLLVDHNRSPHNRSLWSEFSRGLSPEQKNRLLEEYYRPFRTSVGNWIAQQIREGGTVLHLSVHSFTPVYAGKVRALDIGLLYDPRRAAERNFARDWQLNLHAAEPGLRVRLNTPYRGTSDCHQTGYRQQYPPGKYLAIELEVNQALVETDAVWLSLKRLLSTSLEQSLGKVSP